MSDYQSFEEFLVQNAPSISVFSVFINLILAGILAYILKRIYITYGTAMSNRVKFANNFFLLTTTTLLIICIVKSSLALSLGLVGALSIVRFRSAIKEPEELAYLFLCISIGLGFGANQRPVTLVGFTFIALIIVMRRKMEKETYNENLLIMVSSKSKKQEKIDEITDLIQTYVSSLKLKRVHQEKGLLEASYLISIEKMTQFNTLQEAFLTKFPGVSITFLDDKGIS